jgi:hypothetical protein
MIKRLVDPDFKVELDFKKEKGIYTIHVVFGQGMHIDDFSCQYILGFEFEDFVVLSESSSHKKAANRVFTVYCFSFSRGDFFLDDKALFCVDPTKSVNFERNFTFFRQNLLFGW